MKLITVLIWLLPSSRLQNSTRIKSNITNFATVRLNPPIYTTIGAENYEDSFTVGYYYKTPGIFAYNEATVSSVYPENCSVGITHKGGVRN
jgi:hypothetical protein